MYRRAANRLLLWCLPPLLAITGVTATLRLTDALVERERVQWERRAESEAKHIAGQLQNELLERLDALRRVGAWWHDQTRPIDAEDWAADQELFLEKRGGLLSVIWLDRWAARAWILQPGKPPADIAERPDALTRDVARYARLNREPAVSTVFTGPNGNPAVYAAIPVMVRGTVVAHVVGLFDLHELLASVMRGQVPPDFSISVIADGRRLPPIGSTDPNRLGSITETAPLRLPNRTWQARVVAVPDDLQTLRTWLLAFGAVVTGLLLTASILGSIARYRASELTAEVRERQAAEKRVTDLNRDLQHRLADFRILLDVSPIGIAVSHDPECRNIWINPALARMMAVPLGESISVTAPPAGGPSFRVLRDGRELTTDELPMRVAARTGADVAGEELQLVRGDGTRMDILAYAAPMFDDTGAVRGVLQACVDITASRRAEQERDVLLEREHAARVDAERALAALERSERDLQRLIEADIIGMIIADPGRILEANEHLLSLAGYSREELTGGIEWSALIPEDHRSACSRFRHALVAAGKAGPIEAEILRRDGKRVPVLIGGVVLGSSPEPRSMCFVLDLTEHRDLENRLRRAEKFQSLALMAGGIAHDFNNLLTAILGNASLALDAVAGGSEAYRLLSLTIEAAERSSELVRSVLAYTGTAFFNVEPLNVSDLVVNVAAALRGSLPSSVDLRLELASGMPLVRAGKAEMEQVVRNLVSNSVDAIGDRPGLIAISTRACHLSATVIHDLYAGQDLEPGLHVELRVADNGCGMSAGTASRAFDPFFSTKFVGRGLGLSEVEGIVRAHRGGIRLQSTEGSGSEFILLLPGDRAQPPPVQETSYIHASGI